MPTPSEVRAFTETGTWAEIARRLADAFKQADARIENPDPYLHGRAAGAREAYRVALNLPDQLIKESGT